MTGSRSLPLLKVFGIRVGVNYSWFLVLFLVIYIVWDSLRDDARRERHDRSTSSPSSPRSRFFGSILLHELGHALAARREGIGVEGIDLFLFGGVMKMSRETDTPGAEFRVAAAGPLVTLLIMALRRRRGRARRGRGRLLGRRAALRQRAARRPPRSCSRCSSR